MVGVILNHTYHNWANTFKIKPKKFLIPENIGELQEIFEDARKNRIKVSLVGNGRSPSDLPCNEQYMVSMLKFNKILEINQKEGYVHVEGGVIMSELQAKLKENGMAFPCLPSISHITIGGAVSSGTHSSGIEETCLSASILELTVVHPNNVTTTYTRQSNESIFRALCCSLGLLGAIVSLKIKVVKSFKLVEEKIPATMESVMKTLDKDLRSSYIYKFMYYPYTNMCVKYFMNKTEMEVKERTSYFKDIFVGYHLYQLALFFCKLFPSFLPTVNRIFFKWLHSTPSTRVNYSDKIMNFEVYFKQYVTEYAFPIERLAYVMDAIDKRILQTRLPLHFPIEVRFVKSDDLFLSQNYGADMAHINLISFKPYGFNCEKKVIWEIFEQLMREVNGRPHWAKLHKCGLERLKILYGDNITKFLEIKESLDPDGILENQYYLRHFKGDNRIVEKISYEP